VSSRGAGNASGRPLGERTDLAVVERAAATVGKEPRHSVSHAAAIRVLIVDDSPLMREGIAAAMRRSPRLDVVGCAEDGVEALELAARLEPDVLLLDMSMPRLGGLGVLERIRTEMPALAALVVTVLEDEATLLNAVAAGAAGYLTKRTTPEELENAVITVYEGGSIISPALARYVLRDYGRRKGAGDRSADNALSARERDVLRLLAQGHIDREIGQLLHMSPRTVQNHLTRIREKTGVRRRSALARWASEHAAA
jgi:DNA-binding NarL/FixJ family response regulator